MRHCFETIERTIAEHRERVFLIEAGSGRSLTYGQMDGAARSLARVLREKGVEPGGRVAIFMPNGLEFACLYFACLYAGAVATPVNTALGEEDKGFILRRTSPALLALGSKTRQAVPQWALAEIPCLELGLPGSEAGWSLDRATSPEQGDPFQGKQDEDLFSLTFTSGTTGRPKGIFHRVRTLFGAAQSFNQLTGVHSGHRFFHCLPMAYMAGFLNNLLSPFLAGASVVIGDAFDARMALAFWQAPIRHQANVMWLVPTILSMVLQLDRGREGEAYARSNLAFIFVGTAPLPGKLKARFEGRYGTELLESYGLSETLFVCANTKKQERLPGSVGPALDGVEVAIADDSGQFLPAGEEGEVMIRSSYLMTARMEGEAGEAQPLDSDMWFPSGDVGRVDGQGHLFITDRKKDLIIRGGVNIAPREIENVLMRHGHVEEAAVVGIPHEFYGEEVVVGLRLTPGIHLQDIQGELDAMCRKDLNPNSVPARFATMGDFPRTSTGKIQKMALRKLLTGLFSQNGG